MGGGRSNIEPRVCPEPINMLAQVRGAPEVLTLCRYLEDRVGQSVHFPNYLVHRHCPKGYRQGDSRPSTGAGGDHAVVQA